MSRILIAYSTVDGHTRKICERLRAHLEKAGHAVALADLGGGRAPAVASFDKVVIGASIRYGKHRDAVYDFIERHREALQSRPGAFFSVNVVARKPGKDSPEGNPYVREFRRRSPWRPDLLGVFAGKIDYRKYGFLDREVVRLIMLITNGPTERDACVEFTDWGRVEAFAAAVASLERSGAAA